MGQTNSKRAEPRYDIFPQTFTTRQHLILLHIFAIVVHVTSAILGSILVSQDETLNVNVIAPLFKYVTGTSGVFLEPTPKTMFTVAILWPPIAVEWITASFHILYIAQLSSRSFDEFIKKYVASSSSLNPLRWTEYAITATMMSAFGSIAIGMHDFYFFLKMLSSGIALQSVGYVLENLSTLEERERLKDMYIKLKDEYIKLKGDYDNDAETILVLRNSTFVLRDVARDLKKREGRLFNLLWWLVGFFLNISSVLTLLWQTFASDLGDALWLYVANSVPFALWFNTFGYIAQQSYRRWRQFADPYFVEKYYILLSLSTKVAVFWLSFGTFRQITESNGAISSSGVNWPAVRYCAMLLPALWLVTYAIFDAIQWRRFVRYATMQEYDLEPFGHKKKNIWKR